MPRSRFAAALVTAVTAASCLAIAPAALAIPANATAAGTSAVTVYAVGSRAGNVGMLWIQAGAASPITSMTAHLIDKKTGADKLNVTDLSLRQGTATYGVWRVAKPITVGQLRPGTYQVQLDVTDSAGTSVTGISAGQFDFIRHR